jgi:hypothetical protein
MCHGITAVICLGNKRGGVSMKGNMAHRGLKRCEVLPRIVWIAKTYPPKKQWLNRAFVMHTS